MRLKRKYAASYGSLIAVVAIAGGFMLERGRIGDLGSLNAALLVFGGTIGAVAFGTPSAILASALRRCRMVFRAAVNTRADTAYRVMQCAILARRAGLSSIEPMAEEMENSLLRRALLLVVDGVSPQEVRRQVQMEIVAEEDRAEADARVFEQAGGYAPTIGIIGAVIGLIQVMRQLSDVEAVGRGIAAAFTATLYGVAIANLVLLPIAARIRSQAKSEIVDKELILEGVTALGEGLSLRLIRTRLETFLDSEESLTLPAIQATLAERMSA